MKKILIILMFLIPSLSFGQGKTFAEFGKYSPPKWLSDGTTLSPVNTSLTLTIGANGGTTGKLTFIASDNDQFYITTNTSDQGAFIGAQSYVFDNDIKSTASDGPMMRMGINPTATAPSIVPSMGDINTGVGAAHDDQLSHVAGGVEGQRISEGDGEISTILSGTVVETITDATSAGDATLTKAGENFDATCSIGDAVVIYGGTTAGDYGTYIVVSIAATILTVDRALAGSDADVDFDVIADGVIIENSTTTAVATLRAPVLIVGTITVYTPNAASNSGTSVADDAAITVTNRIMRMVGADAEAVLDTDPAINDGSADGEIAIIQGTADANLVTIADNVNTQLAGGLSMTLGDGDILCLMWDSNYSMWIEQYRSDN